MTTIRRHRSATRPRRGRRAVAATVVAATLALAGCASGSAVSVVPPAALVDIGSGLSGPSGLTATVLAQGLANVSGLAEDGEGRIWAATAAFEDSGTDGVYLVDATTGTATRVVTDIHAPMGLVWADGWLYIASTGRVDAFSSFDAATATFTESRTVLELPDGVGQSDGLVMGSDGRLSLGISAPCDACDPESDLSGSIVSFLPDGTDLRVDVSDVRAPVGLAYRPGTDDLFVTMNQRDDLGDATPGDLLSAVAVGQSWGAPECTGVGAVAGTDASTCASVPTPVAELDQHAAVSGLAFVTGQLGPTIGDAAIVAEWATGVVKRVALTGSTGTASTFLDGFDNPVPVLTTADGSLLVGDWTRGTIYRITAAGSTTGTTGGTAPGAAA